jgi:uncharacterized repeat protein (TIGR03803 family)
VILKTFSAPDPVSGTNDDGYAVRSGLAAVGGNLFGTASQGGNFANGVVFTLRMDGSGYTVLRHFSATSSDTATNFDGADPFPSLAIAGSKLYGTTQYGGVTGAGTLFSLELAPGIQLDNPFGPGVFAFQVTGYSNQVLVIESSPDIATPAWMPVQTNIVGAGPVSFTDPNWRSYPQRFYRVRME